jgi:hypothetical protein
VHLRGERQLPIAVDEELEKSALMPAPEELKRSALMLAPAQASPSGRARAWPERGEIQKGPRKG